MAEENNSLVYEENGGFDQLISEPDFESHNDSTLYEESLSDGESTHDFESGKEGGQG